MKANVELDIRVIQQLIRYNKTQIKELDTEKKYLEHIIQLYYHSCNPLDKKGALSSTAFSSLNKAKDDLIKIKKMLKLLSEVQYALKSSIR